MLCLWGMPIVSGLTCAGGSRHQLGCIGLNWTVPTLGAGNRFHLFGNHSSRVVHRRKGPRMSRVTSDPVIPLRVRKNETIVDYGSQLYIL